MSETSYRNKDNIISHGSRSSIDLYQSRGQALPLRTKKINHLIVQLLSYLINNNRFYFDNFTQPQTRVQLKIKSNLAVRDRYFINAARNYDVKKNAPNTPQPPDQSTLEAIDIPRLCEITEPLVSARLRNPNRPDPVSHVFTIIPNVDTESLLCHACETLASLNVMATDLACEVEGSRRNVMLAIQQLAVLGELLVNRALDNLDPPGGFTEAAPNK
jgi:hypothetical protein